MTATEVRCPHCRQTYLVPFTGLDRFEEARLIHWVDTHTCVAIREAVA